MHKFTTHISLELYEFAAFLAGPNGDAIDVLNGFLKSNIDSYIALKYYHQSHWDNACPHDVEILDRGYIQVTLTICGLVWEKAANTFASEGYFGIEDYLLGILNNRLMQAMADYDDDLDSWEPDWRPLWLQNWLNENNGFKPYIDFDGDDDFPF